MGYLLVPSGSSVGFEIWCLDRVIIWWVLIGIGAVWEVSVELGSGEVEGDVALRDTGEMLELSDEDTSD
jgi:hypothetical protein